MNLVISEALATGLPVIATDHSGLPEQVIDGYNGAVVPEGDYEALAEKILWLMENPDAWEKFGRNARIHVAEHYAAEKLIPAQIAWYKSLINSKSEEVMKNSKQDQIRQLWENEWVGLDVDCSQLGVDTFTREAFARFLKFVDQDDRRILELGCGRGRFSALMAGAHRSSQVLGVDISAASIENCQKLADARGGDNLAFAVGNVFALDYPDGYFDVVFSEGLLVLFSLTGESTYEDALKEMVRVTKPGGKVIASVSNWWCLPHTIYKALRGTRYEYGYEKSFSFREMRALYKKMGLTQVRREGFDPAHAFYRLCRLNCCTRIIHRLGRLVEAIDSPWFSRKFGMQIVVVGVKSDAASRPDVKTTV